MSEHDNGGPAILAKDIMWFGRESTLACDANCGKAWGIQLRPKVQIGADEDDVAWLADGELGDAPADPGTYEGGWGKPTERDCQNKWCARECERSVIVDRGRPIKLPDYTRRRFNQPHKHEDRSHA